MTTAAEETTVRLTDVWNAVRRYRYRLFAAVIAAPLLSYTVTSFVPRQWEASVLLQVGQVGQVGMVGQLGVVGQQPQLLEMPGNMVPRMMQPSFLVGLKSRVRANALDLSDDDARLLKDSFRAAQAKNSELVEVKLRAYSPELAEQLIQSCIAYVRVAQDDSYEAGIARLRAQKDATSRDILATRALLKGLDQQLRQSQNVNERLFAEMLVQNKNDELRNLEQSERLLVEQLSPAKSYQTRPFGDIYVSDEPVFPKKGLIAVVIFFISFVLGVPLAIVMHTSVKMKAR